MHMSASHSAHLPCQACHVLASACGRRTDSSTALCGPAALESGAEELLVLDILGRTYLSIKLSVTSYVDEFRNGLCLEKPAKRQHGKGQG